MLLISELHSHMLYQNIYTIIKQITISKIKTAYIMHTLV